MTGDGSPRPHFAAAAVLLMMATSPGVAGLVAFEDSYHVLKDRQRFISLRAFFVDDSDPTSVADSDLFIWRVLKGPARGRLLGAAPNLIYVPAAGFTGDDGFSFRVEYKEAMREGVVHVRVAEAYVPPFGIPAPEFGITNTHEALARGGRFDYGRGLEPYRTGPRGPYTHCIDLENGRDLNNPLGSPAQPRRTIPTEPLPAGSIVEIHGNAADRDVGGAIIIRTAADTSAGRPVFIRGVDAEHKPLLRRGLVIRGNYVVVENLDFECSQPGSTREWVKVAEFRTSTNPQAWETFHHVAVRHCSFRSFPTQMSGGAFAMSFLITHNENIPNSSPDDDRHRTEYCVAYDNSVRDFGNWKGRDAISDYAAIQFASNARHGWCLDSVFDHIQGDGVGLSRNNALPGQAPSEDIYVGGNHIHHMKENCIDVKMTRRAVLSQNHLYRVRVSDSSLGQAIGIENNDHCDAWPYTDQLWILFNEIYDAPYAVMGIQELHKGRGGKVAYADSRLYVAGNVIHHIQAFDAKPAENYGWGVGHHAQFQSRVVGNTFYRCGAGASVGCVQEASIPANDNTSMAVVNNLFLNPIHGGRDIRSCRIGRARPVLSELHHCMHWPAMGVDLGGRFYAKLDELRLLNVSPTTPPYGMRSMDVDPLLVDVKNLDFRPKRGSPALGAGERDALYQMWEREFPRARGYPAIDHDARGARFDGAVPIGALLP